jgi:hypothetical protein
MASVLPEDVLPPPEPPLPRRVLARRLTAAAALVVGLGLIGGAVAGSWLGGEPEAPAPSAAYERSRDLWHTTEVDRLFPRTLKGEGAGPGGADRSWTRIAVAPDSGCRKMFDPMLSRALAPVGCTRLLRATYVDATHSSLTTVGLLFTKAGAGRMGVLRDRFAAEELDERTDLLPRPYAPAKTAAAGFGDRQRASWSVRVLNELPVVVYSVTGFADGRKVTAAQPAAEAVRDGAATTAALAGLGHDAQGVADRIERALRKTSARATESPR